MWKRTTAAASALAAVIVAVVTMGTLAPTPDYTGITAEAGNQLGSAPSLLAGVAGPVLGVVMLFVGFWFVIRAIRRAAH